MAGGAALAVVYRSVVAEAEGGIDVAREEAL